MWIISYYIHPKYQSQGYATELARELLKFGFNELEAQKVEAFHAAFNKASQSVLEKIGMSFVKQIPKSFQKHGRWVTDNRFVIDKVAWIDLNEP